MEKTKKQKGKFLFDTLQLKKKKNNERSLVFLKKGVPNVQKSEEIKLRQKQVASLRHPPQLLQAFSNDFANVLIRHFQRESPRDVL